MVNFTAAHKRHQRFFTETCKRWSVRPGTFRSRRIAFGSGILIGHSDPAGLGIAMLSVVTLGLPLSERSCTSHRSRPIALRRHLGDLMHNVYCNMSASG
jgi:hypothetical protein